MTRWLSVEGKARERYLLISSRSSLKWNKTLQAEISQADSFLEKEYCNKSHNQISAKNKCFIYFESVEKKTTQFIT